MTSILRPLKKSKNYQICTFDIETISWINTRIVGFYDGSQLYYFRTVKQFLKFFLSYKYRSFRCFAHYGAGFDFNFILAERQNFPDYQFQFFDQNGVGIIIIKKGRFQWIFHDSYKLLPFSLANLGKTFKTEHQKLDVDRNKIENLTYDELKQYVGNDCMCLYESLVIFRKWLSKYNCKMMPTIASQSMALFRHSMKDFLIGLPYYVEEFVRKGYHGGRTEVFNLESEHTYCYDVSSMYPFIMRSCEMPVGKPVKVESFHPDMIGFYFAEVDVPYSRIPVLPFHYDNTLIFPTGKIRGHFTSAELKKAMEYNAEVKIIEGYVFHSAIIFRDYIDMLYKLKMDSKKNDDAVTYNISKLLMNSLYGKFGQGREKLIFKFDVPIEETMTRYVEENGEEKRIPPEWEEYDSEYNIFCKSQRSRANFIIPSIASWISSLARLELFSHFEKAGLENVFYCDTDSVFCSTKLKTGDEIGELKLEHEADHCIFIRPKTYILQEKDNLIVKLAGFSDEFSKNLTIDDFKKAVKGDYSSFKYKTTKFAKYKESLVRTGRPLSVIDVVKSIRKGYTKRSIIGTDTVPIHFRTMTDQHDIKHFSNLSMRIKWFPKDIGWK